MMDTESGVDGGDYYRRRLTVTAYGQWLVWLSSEKSQAVEDEERAVRCRLFGSRLTAMSRLAALVSASRRNSYHLRLADAIHTLVLLKKGLQRWRYYRALAESVDSWALQRWAQQRSLFRALCRLHDALRRRKFSRLLSPGRLQLAKVAVECWAEFTSHSLRSRGQQRRADVCWRRLALKRAVGRLRRREQHACQAWAAAQTGRRLYLRQAVVRAFRGYWSNVLKGREARGMLQSAARSARVSSTRTAFHHLHAYALRRVGRKRDVKGDVVWVQMAAVGQRRFIVALLRRMRRRLLRSPLVSRVSAHQRCIWSFRRFSAGLLSWQCTHHSATFTFSNMEYI
ncbi:hypothetical protein B484DRAFT_2112 [Ochromonadaceae sp. CCMP2298]|nr:hypothetical protein B484DRAFT_2112 [Ochromonadaceae sp. CCMP2298]